MVGTRASKFIPALAVVLLFCASFAAGASAKGEEDIGAFGVFRLQGTNGYSILVTAFSRSDLSHGEVVVWATKKDASVIYAAPATVTPTRIDADLGAAGRISVDFEAEGSMTSVHAGCGKGGAIPFQPGQWIGTIELAGEEGFTRVQTTSAKSIPSPLAALICGGFGISEVSGHGVRGARLVARSANSKHALFLQVNKNHRDASVRVEVSLEERRGSLLVNREVVHRYPATAFSFDPLMRSATFSPPAPFSGSATFHRGAKPANRWAGNLSVDFPGRANVRLGGRRFHAALVRAERTEGETTNERLARAL